MSIESSDSVLFDLDGVLVDSRAAISSAINHALDAHGLPEQAPASLHRFIGPPLVMAFAELTGQPQDSGLVLSCVASYRERYSESSLRETSVIPGIREALDELSERHRLAVATSKALAFAEPLLRELGLREAFEVVAGPQLSARGQDKAAAIRVALSALGSRRSVMVGDRSFDIAGAHACEIPAIGVCWGIGSPQELAASGAEVLVDRPSELPGAVNRVVAGKKLIWWVMIGMKEAMGLALVLPEATVQDHHGIPSLRVRGKIFATVPDERHLRVMVDHGEILAAVAEDPEACSEFWWGSRLAAVLVDLRLVRADLLGELLEEAWRRKAPRRLAGQHARSSRSPGHKSG